MAAFMVDFYDEVEEEFIKREPKQEFSDTDMDNENEDQQNAEVQIKEEIDIEWHELNIDDNNADLVQNSTSLPLTTDQLECDRQFQLGSTANEDKPFQCELYDHTFKLRSNHLDRHIISEHAYAKQIWLFNCRKCDYKGKSISMLTKHIISKHLNADKSRWFKCEKCDLKCKRNASLNRHMIHKHLNEDEMKWFPCEKCDHKFKEKISLDRHVISKHLKADDITWFKCEKCNFKGKHKRSLKSHVIHKHKKTKLNSLNACIQHPEIPDLNKTNEDEIKMSS